MAAKTEEATPSRAARIGLVAGPALFVAMLLFHPPELMPEAAWRVAALALWMAIWWSTEALPVAATGLLPILVLPATGVAPIADAVGPYSNPLIFLFLGGFLIALAVERWELHRRFALAIVLRVGTRPAALAAGFMAATGLLSMWVSNTATAVLMLPIAISVLGQVGEERGEIAPALLLSVAYGASIGGLATLIGTPPNALLAAYAQEAYGVRIGFAQWMALGLPISLIMGVLAWLILTRVIFRLPSGELATGGREALRRQYEALGRLSRQEARVGAIFVLAALLWLTRPLLETLPGLGWIDDTSVAIFAGLLLFLVPAGEGRGRTLLVWSETARLPWGTLILFGGGLSLAAAISDSGLAEWIGGVLEMAAAWPALLLVALVAAVVVFLTELTSNTATTAAFLPIMGVVAVQAGLDPLQLMAPAALAASAAFMLPVATPPNAIVHGSGRVSIPEMARAGFLLNLATIASVTLLAPVLLRVFFGAVGE
jgi:solute carrier family 13 (sodium-dependent dicarboxylate transporter), member 2/3/5